MSLYELIRKLEKEIFLLNSNVMKMNIFGYHELYLLF